MSTFLLRSIIVILGMASVGATLTLTATRQGAPLLPMMLAGAALGGVGLLLGRKMECFSLNWPARTRTGIVWWLLAAGLLVRAGYALAVEPVQISDAAAYSRSAGELAQTGEYRQHINRFLFRSYLPPAYPAVLSVFVKAGLAGNTAVLVANGVIFLFCGYGIYLLLQGWGLTAGQAIAGLAVFVIWPGMVPWFNLAFTDTLALTFLVWALVSAFDNRRAILLLSGCLVALAALTRGQFILYAGVILLFRFMREPSVRSFVLRSAGPFLAGLVLCWSPWVVRNYIVLGALVPLSTNGGDILYRANNELATGGFIERGERDYWPLVTGEVQLYRMTTAWALDWIRAHPVAFLQLGVKKFFLLMGEDHLGYYFSLRWPHAEQRLLYAACQLISNTWWLAAWMTILAGRNRIGRALRGSSDRIVMVVAIPLVTAGVHFVFESGSRYHMPMLPTVIFLAVLAATTGTGKCLPPGDLNNADQ